MKNYQPIWQKALPLLKKGKRKDFVLHTKYVVKAMKEIMAKEGGEQEILIPAAILHDIGWSQVPLEFQLSSDRKRAHQALVQHIEKGIPLVSLLFYRVFGEFCLVSVFS